MGGDRGTPGFSAVTKRIHNRPHGAVDDGGALDDRARAGYERVPADKLPTVSKRVRPGDVVTPAEPFGLTVADAIWKGRPVVASGIGDLRQRARERVRDEFTSPRSLLDYLRLIRCALERSGVRATV